jgi:hypothetical protein
MQYQFDSLSEMLQQSIIAQSCAVLRQSKVYYWDSTMNGLSKMGYNWKQDVNIEKAICEGIMVNYRPTNINDRRYNGRGITLAVHFLGEMSGSKGNLFRLQPEVMNCIWNAMQNADFTPAETAAVFCG